MIRAAKSNINVSMVSWLKIGLWSIAYPVIVAWVSRVVVDGNAMTPLYHDLCPGHQRQLRTSYSAPINIRRNYAKRRTVIAIDIQGITHLTFALLPGTISIVLSMYFSLSFELIKVV